MKTYKDIYEFPLHQAKYGSWVYDKVGNFVFQFEPRFDKKGDFEKTPNCFLSGIGCKKCGNKRISDYQKENPNGWDLNTWIKKAKNSKYFDSFKVYIIKCWNENEEFYKIGRTFMTINNRFKTKKMLPYNFKVIKEILGDADFIFNLENELKFFNKEYKYKPKIKFSGINECYSNIKNICLT